MSRPCVHVWTDLGIGVAGSGPSYTKARMFHCQVCGERAHRIFARDDQKRLVERPDEPLVTGDGVEAPVASRMLP